MVLELREAIVDQADYNQFETMYKNFEYSEIEGQSFSRSEGVLKTQADYTEYITEKGNILFVELDGTVIGYAILAWYEDGGVRIHEFHIIKEYQRKGYGKKAVKKLIELVKNEGFKWLELMSFSIGTDCFWSACNFRYIGHDEQYEFHIK